MAILGRQLDGPTGIYVLMGGEFHNLPSAVAGLPASQPIEAYSAAAR
jgi:hypothetical protein